MTLTRFWTSTPGLSFASLLALSLVAAACGTDGDDDEDTSATTAPTTTLGTTMTTTTAMTADSGDSGSGDTAPTEVDYMADIQPIWDANCTTLCHEPGGAYSVFDLTASMSFAEMATKPGYSNAMTFVVPGSSAESFLIGALRIGAECEEDEDCGGGLTCPSGTCTGVFVRRMPLLPGIVINDCADSAECGTGMCVDMACGCAGDEDCAMDRPVCDLTMGQCGNRAGLDGAEPLGEADIQLIEAWIDAGANP